ncbi:MULTISPECIES: CDP-diacylglycerol--glycerol-3-phosphate 3-phosphatidyltransferase [Glutamicibacter]|uniref:CDP-diacylglycerol--glycerol-3-phosphate 3-phosphatidyltransferase n=2 Tax=Glutamicibacter arilaitensis TaxID=256701 RepID=A0A2N7S5S1_9MICC|nr:MULTISPECIES: CDP-diacylglycerol--glycerol-3-phosphate 3-phosphatidyltransferase [Glutamicibacter]PMQ21488.1 CDP-diacylglycerol--glycerol-3-phosphate 3-phosphatidyltransferase [Glutamicibacter arilaitensis]CBT75307.1 putative CDP-diacylglycerol--glycerol-3-phosphate 3-phosphatidyltransferase [Glutamicibacter arilaitensis Re117]HCH46456.1 CDP-diacylglycerol--glycerol-3-phosphate 3-phosphatidyltransferase [Glutamicibacter sp.]HCM95562.1 CDP-diacylglycerol--glycerol-3-phosphate 3-phosphatidyltr
MSEQAGSSAQQPVPTLNIANVLTTIRIIMVPFFVWALLFDDHEQRLWRWVALGLFVVAMYTDKLDGDLARSRGLVTNFGKIADPIADKLLTGSALVCFSILDELHWWVTIVILVREWGITLLRVVVIRYGVIAANMGGKIKTVLQAIVIGLYLLPYTYDIDWLGTVAWYLMLLTLAVTVVTGLEYLVKAGQLVATAKKQK